MGAKGGDCVNNKKRNRVVINLTDQQALYLDSIASGLGVKRSEAAYIYLLRAVEDKAVSDRLQMEMTGAFDDIRSVFRKSVEGRGAVPGGSSNTPRM
jgi:hypothetical protein